MALNDDLDTIDAIMDRYLDMGAEDVLRQMREYFNAKMAKANFEEVKNQKRVNEWEERIENIRSSLESQSGGLEDETPDVEYEFDTYDDVDGLQTCKKTAVAEAKQMDAPFKVDSQEGEVYGDAGDYLMKGVNDELYVCGQEEFEQSYEFVESSDDDG